MLKNRLGLSRVIPGVVMALLLVACGGGSSSAPGISTTKITLAKDGAQVSFTGSQIARIADVASSDSIAAALGGSAYMPSGRVMPNSGYTVYDRLRAPLSRLGKIRQASENRFKARNAAAASATTSGGTVSCTVSGSYDYVYNTTMTSMDITETYHDCNDGMNEVWNGVLHVGLDVSGLSSATVTMRLGDGNDVADSSDFTVKTYSGASLLSTTTASLSYKVDVSGLLDTTLDYHLHVNGIFELAFTADAANGAELSKTYVVDYNRLDARASWDSVNSIMSQTMNGGFLVTRTDNAVSPVVTESAKFDYTSLKLVSQINTAGNYQLSIDGTFSSDFTPDVTCFEGTFTFATVTPIEFDPVTEQTIAGHITINSNVDVVFNPDGSVSVSTDGGATYTAYTHAELEGACVLPVH